MTQKEFLEAIIQKLRDFGYTDEGIEFLLKEEDNFNSDWKIISRKGIENVPEDEMEEYIKEIAVAAEFNYGVR